MNRKFVKENKTLVKEFWTIISKVVGGLSKNIDRDLDKYPESKK